MRDRSRHDKTIVWCDLPTTNLVDDAGCPGAIGLHDAFGQAGRPSCELNRLCSVFAGFVGTGHLIRMTREQVFNTLIGGSTARIQS